MSRLYKWISYTFRQVYNQMGIQLKHDIMTIR